MTNATHGAKGAALSILLVLWAISAVGQNKHSIQVEGGYVSGYLKDTRFSPLNYTKSTIRGSIEYSLLSENNKNLYSVALHYGQGTINTAQVQQFRSQSFQAMLSMSYMRNITTATGPFSLWVGAQYQSRGQLYVWNNYDSAWGYMIGHSLGAKLAAQYQFARRHELHSSIAVPLVQLMTRTPYNGLDERRDPLSLVMSILFNGKVVSMDKYFGIDWSVGYKYNMTRSIDLGLRYNLFYQNLTDTDPVRGLDHSLLMNITINF